MPRLLTLFSSLAVLSSLAFVACDSEEVSTPNPGTTPQQDGGPGPQSEQLAAAQPAVDQYVKNVHAGYAESLAKAQAMKTAIDAFLAAPSELLFEEAKEAWLAARLPYGPTEVYRFYNGPIDNEETGTEGAINGWPLDENYIDYVRDDANAGIINDTTVTLTKDVIRGRNEVGGEKNLATGYHAIEFLLWGQDVEDASLLTAGNRPYTDYEDGGTAANQDRRREYLKLVTEILIEDLQSVVDAWAPNQENYAKTFAADRTEAVTKMLTGMGSLANAELSGERMTVAYKNRTQEDEHSCFSDNTNADLLGNMIGIQNVYLGTGAAGDGPGLDDLVKAVDAELNTKMTNELADAVTKLEALEATPFDAAIQAADGSPERARVLAAIEAIKAVAKTTVEVGTALGVSFQVEQPSEEL